MLKLTDAGKTMIFFSLHYPFHFTDSYLDDEVNLLATKFDRVIILSSNTFTDEERLTPANSIVYRFQPIVTFSLRLRSLALFFKPLFYAELFSLLFLYRLKPRLAVLKELFAFYARAIATRDKLEHVIAEQKVDLNNLLIYTYWMVESTMASVLLKQQNGNVHLVTRAHSQDVYFERSPVGYHPYRRFMFGLLDHLFFISENAREYFIEKHAIAAAEAQLKTSINRIGINGGRATYMPASGNPALRLISVGYIQKLKRIDLIVDALALIKDMKIEWVHVGHSNQSPEDFESIKAYTKKKFEFAPNISYEFTGKTAKPELFMLYEERNFDVFLNVSETEGIPVSMMEAMSYSVPVIGTNVGGVKEIVEDNVNGLLLSAYPDATEVSSAILQFNALSIADKNRMRQNAFTTWSSKYNAGSNYAEVANKITHLMA